MYSSWHGSGQHGYLDKIQRIDFTDLEPDKGY